MREYRGARRGSLDQMMPRVMRTDVKLERELGALPVAFDVATAMIEMPCDLDDGEAGDTSASREREPP